jgi:hypothetical protein
VHCIKGCKGTGRDEAGLPTAFSLTVLARVRAWNGGERVNGLWMRSRQPGRRPVFLLAVFVYDQMLCAGRQDLQRLEELDD